jgi:hypothetical protein
MRCAFICLTASRTAADSKIVETCVPLADKISLTEFMTLLPYRQTSRLGYSPVLAALN